MSAQVSKAARRVEGAAAAAAAAVVVAAAAAASGAAACVCAGLLRFVLDDHPNEIHVKPTVAILADATTEVSATRLFRNETHPTAAAAAAATITAKPRPRARAWLGYVSDSARALCGLRNCSPHLHVKRRRKKTRKKKSKRKRKKGGKEERRKGGKEERKK
jgi:hypothetical protein